MASDARRLVASTGREDVPSHLTSRLWGLIVKVRLSARIAFGSCTRTTLCTAFRIGISGGSALVCEGILSGLYMRQRPASCARGSASSKRHPFVDSIF